MICVLLKGFDLNTISFRLEPLRTKKLDGVDICKAIIRNVLNSIVMHVRFFPDFLSPDREFDSHNTIRDDSKKECDRDPGNVELDDVQNDNTAHTNESWKES